MVFFSKLNRLSNEVLKIKAFFIIIKKRTNVLQYTFVGSEVLVKTLIQQPPILQNPLQLVNWN